jgi:2-polyprenyl-3-methyl-5-hydroxy-6-metoxy-1,4-benzoquinol methylase
MAYDWAGELNLTRYCRDWFDAIDARFVHGSRLFATDRQPFDRLLPFEILASADVLEIGCGMGLHTELMVKAGANVTAVDLSETSIEATTARLALKGLNARVMTADAEHLAFPDASFDFVWSWGVIHHSARTARIVRQIARVLRPGGECRVMVYNREGMMARIVFVKDYLFTGAFRGQTFDEVLYRQSDGFSARFFVREHFEDLFRAFFANVSSKVMGQESDVIPLPRKLRALALKLTPDAYLRRAQAKRGAFIFLRAREPE